MKNRNAIKQLLNDLTPGAFADDLFDVIDQCKTNTNIQNILSVAIKDAETEHINAFQRNDFIHAGDILTEISIVTNIKDWISEGP